MPPEERAPFLNRLFDLPVVDDRGGLRWARPVNHMQRRIARSGVLYMDESQLGFRPRGLDAALGARPMAWDLSTIVDVTLKPTLRKLRLTVTTTEGKQRFIVSNPAVVYNDLSAWRKAHGDAENKANTAPPVRSVPAEEGGAPA
jgi:hypothetical protein